MGKYVPLRKFLESQQVERVRMTFDEIERVIGERLPPSKKYPAWWSNNPSNNVMTKEWLAAGYETEQVDTGGEKLVFRRLQRVPAAGAAEPLHPKNSEIADTAQRRDYRSIFECMKGTLSIDPNYDVAAPLDVDWGEPYLGVEERR